MRTVEKTRTFWASIDPPESVDRTESTAWRVFINLTVDERADDDGRNQIQVFDIEMTRRGWAAFAEFDAALRARGYARSGGWELGAGHGYVAWVELDDIAP